MSGETLLVALVVLIVLWRLVVKARWHRNRRRDGLRHRLTDTDGWTNAHVVRPERPLHPRRKARVFDVKDVRETPEGE